jgi:hypothetical protein
MGKVSEQSVNCILKMYFGCRVSKMGSLLQTGEYVLRDTESPLPKRGRDMTLKSWTRVQFSSSSAVSVNAENTAASPSPKNCPGTSGLETGLLRCITAMLTGSIMGRRSGIREITRTTQVGKNNTITTGFAGLTWNR